MEPEKVAAYRASSVRFSFFIKVVVCRFLELLWRPVNN